MGIFTIYYEDFRTSFILLHKAQRLETVAKFAVLVSSVATVVFLLAAHETQATIHMVMAVVSGIAALASLFVTARLNRTVVALVAQVNRDYDEVRGVSRCRMLTPYTLPKDRIARIERVGFFTAGYS